MRAGWDARGLIAPIWRQAYQPPKQREQLAEAIDVPANNLSAINQGKRLLSINTARKIADATGVSLWELGAPQQDQTDLESVPLRDRLEALEALVAEIARYLTLLGDHLQLPENERWTNAGPS